MSAWGPKWRCRAALSPDCVNANGPICKACTKLIDGQDAHEIKLAFNKDFSRDEVHAMRFCETVGCWGVCRKKDWERKRCGAFLAVGDVSGCNVPGALDGLKCEATEPGRCIVTDSFTLFEPPVHPPQEVAAAPPPPVAAKAEDNMRSAFEGLLRRIDGVVQNVQDIHEDLCMFYDQYSAADESGIATTPLRVSSPMVPSPVVEAGVAADVGDVQEGAAPRSRSRHRQKRSHNDGGGHMMSSPPAPRNSQLKNIWL